MAKRKKVKSPTGKPSKVNPAITGLMSGKDVRGKRTSTFKTPNISKPISPGVALGSGGLSKVAEALAKKRRPRKR